MASGRQMPHVTGSPADSGGWEETNGVLKTVWTRKPSVPESCVELVTCKCDNSRVFYTNPSASVVGAMTPLTSPTQRMSHLSPANATIANAAHWPASAFGLVKFVCQHVDVQQTAA